MEPETKEKTSEIEGISRQVSGVARVIADPLQPGGVELERAQALLGSLAQGEAVGGVLEPGFEVPPLLGFITPS